MSNFSGMAKLGPRPKIADGLVICLTILLMGAPSVLGSHISALVGYLLFYGGLFGLLAYPVIRWGGWAFGLLQTPDREEQPKIDNKGGAYVGGNNTGNQTIYNAPVTIHDEAQMLSGPLFEEVRKINEFLGAKDEMGLRRTFDYPNLLARNIAVTKSRIEFIKRGDGDKFLYAPPYTDGNNDLIAKIQNCQITPQGVSIISKPNEIFIIVTTKKYQDSVAEITRLENSGLIPSSITFFLKEFHAAIDQNSELMITVLNNHIHDFENFILNDAVGSRYYKVIDNMYWRLFVPLKPLADKVTDAIRLHWKLK